MVIEALIVTAVASAMLGWNIHVIWKSGACCPPEGSEAEQASRPRSVQRTNSQRRRRRSLRKKMKEHQEASRRTLEASTNESNAEKRRSSSRAAQGTVNGEGDVRSTNESKVEKRRSSSAQVGAAPA